MCSTGHHRYSLGVCHCLCRTAICNLHRPSGLVYLSETATRFVRYRARVRGITRCRSGFKYGRGICPDIFPEDVCLAASFSKGRPRAGRASIRRARARVRYFRMRNTIPALYREYAVTTVTNRWASTILKRSLPRSDSKHTLYIPPSDRWADLRDRRQGGRCFGLIDYTSAGTFLVDPRSTVSFTAEIRVADVAEFAKERARSRAPVFVRAARDPHWERAKKTRDVARNHFGAPLRSARRRCD